ncbi:hypothetical protein JAK44_17490 [Stenotrophomonas maltophilia]|uniref:hypothetical protein n=1 Tax=Stenotrophomonas TaxID=40323 RepID=UPI0010704122|nr:MULTISPECIES: hypothetical protein [Stenotrophomonas]MCU1002737.1 hypothetical protein [Stenotrophomonas maltophilia]
MSSKYIPNTTLKDGREVYLEACDVDWSSTAFSDQGLEVGKAVFTPLDADNEEFLVTNIEVIVGYQGQGLSVALIKEFASETGAGIWFENRVGVALDSGAHLTTDGQGVAAALVKKGIARWHFPD